MQANYRIEDIDGVTTTLTVTMSIKQWKELRSQLSAKYPSWKFGGKISEMINEANKHFEEIDDE